MVNIGDTFQGGKVGYILQPGDYGYDSAYQKGIIVVSSNIELNAYQYWDRMDRVYTGVTQQAIGYGLTNTNSIISTIGSSFDDAVGRCYLKSYNGYSDWYLPTVGELQAMWSNGILNSSYFGTPATGSYTFFWASCDYSTDDAYRVDRYTGNASTQGKYYTNFWVYARNFTIAGTAIPTLDPTTAASSITLSTAVSGGNVTSDGGATITQRGICWSTSQNPTTANSKTIVAGTTGSFSGSITGLNGATTYYVRAYAVNSNGTSYGTQINFLTLGAAPTVTSEAVSLTTDTTATGNGTVVSDGGATITERGVCISTSPYPTTANTKFTSAGTTGAFTVSMTALAKNTTYNARAYAINSIGTSYGDNVQFITFGWLNPTNAYVSDNTYTQLAGAISGELGVSLSTDGGANYTAVLTKIFTGTEQYLTYGAGATETWGTTLNGDNIDNTDLRLKITHNGISQVYKNFGFSIGAGTILTGFEVAIEAKYVSGSLYVDHIRAKIHYGTSVIEVKAGAQAYASNGRTGSQTAGNGTGVLVYFNGTNWKACDSGNDVVA